MTEASDFAQSDDVAERRTFGSSWNTPRVKRSYAFILRTSRPRGDLLRDRVSRAKAPTVATVGCMRFEPNAINVIPSRAVFTVDLRSPNEGRLRADEAALAR
ncbi:hypothetical protein [Sabulicella rubraurantiaca]|uniref:hypothetical protein n=1 Tax=Sabulicella rubraurantiaca TaxID=2811429 RepID=UPI001F261644|nr:hypothetical protein [Sabulicella rubraurantiaca]